MNIKDRKGIVDELNRLFNTSERAQVVLHAGNCRAIATGEIVVIIPGLRYCLQGNESIIHFLVENVSQIVGGYMPDIYIS